MAAAIANAEIDVKYPRFTEILFIAYPHVSYPPSFASRQSLKDH
jgi:hypothetical protein